MSILEEMSTGKYISYSEAAIMFKCGRAHIQSIVNDPRNKISWIKPARKKLIRKADLEAYVESSGNFNQVS